MPNAQFPMPALRNIMGIQADVIYSGSQFDVLWPRNPVSLRNRVSQYLTNLRTAISVLATANHYLEFFL
jgi:hypothetical protein